MTTTQAASRRRWLTASTFIFVLNVLFFVTQVRAGNFAWAGVDAVLAAGSAAVFVDALLARDAA